MHAERVTGDPQAVRWVVADKPLSTGRVYRAPGELGRLFDDGTLTGGLVENTAVWLWLRDGLTWREQGAAVSDALRCALDEPDGWDVRPTPEVLQRVTHDLLDGPVGDFLRSHGGSAAISCVGEDAVAVQLGGACEHCPASTYTLRLRLLGELRRRCPNLVEVESSRGSGQLVVRLTPEPV